jgi:hypothetical protein
MIGLRPVEGSPNIAKKKQSTIFAVIIMYFFFRSFLILPSMFLSLEIAVQGPILVAAFIKRDLDATYVPLEINLLLIIGSKSRFLKSARRRP